ncbi:hypothetical protein PAJ_0283 [Pantoea ananatis AJ13355]|uniref:Uncharacterized protein n=1 Tax=Pantoea ananatis (strain AJ13355) TaxID=932677 RepID=A0A0H3KXI6_PANAA|nr:hypothetical protein PAJ_0283 [Pantoea ananatis AJ13355]
MALLSHAVQHTPHAEDIAVYRRQRGGQHNKIQDGRGGGNAQMLERQNKRAAVSADLIPRVNGHDDKQRAHVKHQDTHRNRVDSAWDRGCRIFGLTRRNTDDFNAAVGKHHHLQRQQHPNDTVGKKAAIGPQVMDTGRLAAVANPPDDHAKPGQNHHNNGRDLKEREPELHLTKHLHAHQIDRADDQHHAQHPDPVRHLRKPDAHIDPERGDIGNGHDQNFKAVGPAGDVTRHWPEIILRIAGKRAGLRVIDRHLTQRAHDDVRHRTANNIGQQHAGARHFDGVRRAVEQPGADRRSQRHKTDVARAQSAFELVGFLHNNLYL